MTVWILHLELTPREEVTLPQTNAVPLPFDNLPDLSKVSGFYDGKKLLQDLYPTAAPETIQHKVDAIWKQYTHLSEDDIIAVPLRHSREIAVAEVKGRYRYQADAEHGEKHSIPVKWHDKRVPFSALKKQQNLMIPGKDRMLEVEAQEIRVAIRDRLPYSYNRFAAWKWILIIFLILQAVMLAFRLAGVNPQ